MLGLGRHENPFIRHFQISFEVGFWSINWRYLSIGLQIHYSRTEGLRWGFCFSVSFRVECLLVLAWVSFQSMHQNFVNGHVFTGRTDLLLYTLTLTVGQINLIIVIFVILFSLKSKTRLLRVKSKFINLLGILILSSLMLAKHNFLNIISLFLLCNNRWGCIIIYRLKRLFRSTLDTV